MSFAAKGKKSSTQNQDKQTPHTVLQKLPPKLTPTPLTPRQRVPPQPHKKKKNIQNSFLGA